MAQSAKKQRTVLPGFAVAVLFLAGCATSAPEPTAVQAFANPERPLEGYSHMIVTCEALRGVEIPKHEQESVAAMVKQEVERRAPGRFVFLEQEDQAGEAASEPGMVEPKTAVMKILFVEYDEGSAFARFMIAGAGQIRIDTDVTLRDKATFELLGEYEVSKQFALGGIAGGTTDVTDVEVGLAKGIAEILVPKPSEGGTGSS